MKVILVTFRSLEVAQTFNRSSKAEFRNDLCKLEFISEKMAF